MNKQLNDKKIVFFDIDGTIFLYTYGIPEDTRKSIQQLKENGHIPVLCTGRTKSMIFPEFLEMGFEGIVGGAGTYLEYKNEVLFEYEMEPARTRDIINLMQSCNIMPIGEGIDGIYFPCEHIPEDYEQIYNLYKTRVTASVKDHTVEKEVLASKMSGYLYENADIEKLKRELGDQFNYLIYVGKYIEMIPKGFSKATGIEKLINTLGIKWENTYAFGDSMNDYEMLKYVNYGVAMGNGTEELKKEMKYVTDDFDKGGITNALRKFDLI